MKMFVRNYYSIESFESIDCGSSERGDSYTCIRFKRDDKTRYFTDLPNSEARKLVEEIARMISVKGCTRATSIVFDATKFIDFQHDKENKVNILMQELDV